MAAQSVVARMTVRRTWKGALAIAVAGVAVTLTAVLGYVGAYPNPADRLTLARSIGSNPGLSALFGETRSLETVAGFTEWRVVLIMAVVGGVWALFAVTRVLRGDEDVGRAELLLAAPLTRTGAARAVLAGLWASLGLLLVVLVAGLVVGVGSDVGAGRSAALGATLASTPAVMAGLGAVTCQLTDNRRRAVGVGAAVLGVWYVVRVIADSSPDLRWLRWWSPLGWLELARPLTAPDLWPVLLSYGLAVALAVVALGLVRMRDAGSGLWSRQKGRRARTALLNSPIGLAARLAGGSALSWSLGLGAFGVLVGLVARTAAEAMAESTGGELLGQIGIADTGARAYVSVSFVFVTVALALAAAGQVSATREEEASNRLENILVRPVGRIRWLAGRLVVGAGVLVLAAGSSVLGTWATSRVGQLGVDVGDLVLAGSNALPVAVVVLGLGTALHGLVPQMAGGLTYAFVAVSFLLEVVGAAVELPAWMLGLSVFHHVAPAPAVAPDWDAAGVLALLGMALAAAGALLLRRRDYEAT